VAGKTIPFRIKNEKHGQQVYQSGLKHRVLTAPSTPDVSIGAPVEIELDLVYADRTFRLLGQVMHTGDVATIVQLDTLPAELYTALGQRPPPGARTDELEQTEESSPATVESSPIQPSSELEETLRSPPRDPYAGGAQAATEPEPTPEPPPAAPQPAAPQPAAPQPAAPQPATPQPAAPQPATPQPAAQEPEREPLAPPVDVAPTPSADVSAPQSSFDEPAPAPAAPASARPRPQSRPMAAPTTSGAATPPPSRQAAQPSTPSSGMPAYQAPATPTPAAGGRGIPLPGRSIQSVPGTSLLEGSLGERSMREIFMDLLRQRSTGLLVVDGFRERYWGYLIEGRPMRYLREPASRSESIEYQISRQKLVDPSTLERVRYVSTIMGFEIDEGLVRLGMLSQDKVSGMLTETATVITNRLLAVNYGSYWFYELPEVARIISGEPVDVMKVLWERSRERFADIDDKAVRELVDKLHKHHVIVTEEGRALTGQLSLGGVEARFLQRYLRGGWQVAELLGRLEMPTRQLMALILALQDLGIITLAEREGPAYKTMRAERFLIDRMDYMDKNHFSFVEAHWSCIEPELLRACDKIALGLDDPIMDTLQMGDIAEMKAAIRDKLVEVRQVFGNTERRRAYRAEVVGEDKRFMAADLFLKQGEMELFKSDSRKADDIFRRVIELDPGGAGSKERVGRAQKVLSDLAKGVITKPLGSQVDLQAEIEEFSPEDLDEG